MTDQPVDQLLRRLADRPVSDALPPATVAPSVVDHLETARRRDRTWLGRLIRDIRAIVDPEAVQGVFRSRPLLAIAAPLLLGVAAVGVFAVGGQRSGPGPDRAQASGLVPVPSTIAIASPVPSPGASESIAAVAPSPVPGIPDGVLVVSTKGSLVVVRSDGSDRHAVTDGSVADYFPMWSPDGTKIAFFSQACVASERCPDKVGGSSLVVIDADGSNRRVLRKNLEDPTLIRWLADGSAVLVSYYVPQKNVTETVGLDGSIGPARALPPDPTLTSPDGSEVVRLKGDLGSDIEIAATDGSTARILVHVDPSVSRVSPIGWAPDGRSVAYVVSKPFGAHDPRTWIIGRDGSDPHPWTDLPEGGRLVGWSADRRWMLVLVPSAEGIADHFVVANGDGSNPRRIDAPAEFLDWTPDRQRLLGLGRSRSTQAGIGDSLVVVDPSGAEPPVEIDAPGLLGWDWRSGG